MLQQPGDAASFDSIVDVFIGRRERRRQEMFDRLLDAARDVIVSRGLEHATVKDITDAADVGKGTFFLYFTSKEHVIPALLERAGVVYEQALERARRGEPVVKLLEELLTTDPASLGLDDPTFFTSQLVAVAAKDDVRKRSLRSIGSNRERMKEILTIGQERGEIRRDLPAADLARLTQQADLGARLLVSWNSKGQTTGDTISSRQLVFALIKASLEAAPAAPTEKSVKRANLSRPAKRRRRRAPRESLR